MITENELGIAQKAKLLSRAIDHTDRQTIIGLLRKNEKMNVTSIYTHPSLKRNGRFMDQSAVSQHLKILRDARLVNSARNGKQMFYTLHKENFQTVLAAFGEAAKVLN